MPSHMIGSGMRNIIPIVSTAPAAAKNAPCRASAATLADCTRSRCGTSR
jgi:hypothetical protein